MMKSGEEEGRLDLSDALVGLGVLAVGAAMWFLVGWAGVLAWAGLLLIIVGAAEARRKGR